MRLERKVALVSGAARGLGAAQARLLAREGASVVVADLLEEPGRQVAGEIGDTGGIASFVKLDTTADGDWSRAVDEAVGRFGKLDVLVNNAGIFQRATIEQTSANDWDRVMGVNAKGVFLGTKAVIPAMRTSGGGSIVNISSISGIMGGKNSAYNASKGATRVFTKSTAVQYAGDGIRANSVHPGPVPTDMLDLVFPGSEEREQRIAAIPMGRFATPKDIAYAVLFLASDESSFMDR